MAALADSNQAIRAERDTTAPSDAALVAAARHDPLAFAPLYERYVEAVYRYCLRRTGDPEQAEDLAATIFIRALEGLPRYRSRGDGGTFRSWLFTIAHHAIVDAYRAKRPRSVLPIDARDDDPGPEVRAVHRDELARLIAVLDRVPEPQRQIIELRLSGLSAAEIAAALGLTRAAVKSAQTRAYARLRDLLAAHDPTEVLP